MHFPHPSVCYRQLFPALACDLLSRLKKNHTRNTFCGMEVRGDNGPPPVHNFFGRTSHRSCSWTALVICKLCHVSRVAEESRDLILFTSTAIPAPTLNASPWQQPRVLAMVEGQMCEDYVCMSCCKVDLYQTDETFQIINTSDLEREKVAFQMFEHQNLKVFIWYLQAYL